MVSTRNIILAAASVSAVSANKHQNQKSAATSGGTYRSDMSESSFVSVPAATSYKGSKVKFDYYTASSADAGLEFMHLIKPVVMRFKESGIDFTPHMLVAPGDADFVKCRSADGGLAANAPHGCDFHCTNDYRYCDKASFQGNAINAKHHSGLHGWIYVKENARLQCIWDKYGSKTASGVYRFFQYMDALKGTGCDKSFSEGCLEQVMQTVDFDYEEIENCVGEVSSGTTDKNDILEKMVYDKVPTAYVPAITFDGSEDTEFERYVENHHGNRHQSVLGKLCKHMGDNKPPVCDFCLNYCPGKAGTNFDMGTCLWELKCGDKNTSFAMYAEENGLSSPQVSADSQPNSFSSKEPRSYSKTASEGLGVVATFMAVVLAAGFAALAVMAIRVWRTKMIIDRYVKEQQAMNDAQQNLGHRDPIYFPDDSALDLDLEPALQYSDHIGGANGRASPPHAASFLPQLT